jgi:hypothetical protein
MDCQKCKIEIEERDLRRESLSDAATAHVASCASCRVFGEERLALRRLVGGLEKVSAPADFEFRVRARMAAEASRNAPRASWFNFSPAALSWPLAACFALAVSATLYFQQQPLPNAATAMPHEQARTVVVAETPAPQALLTEAPSQSAPARNAETLPGTDALSLKNSLAAHRRVLPARAAVGRTTFDGAQIRARLEESNSASLPVAPVMHTANNPAATTGERVLIPVQVSAQERPLKVLLRETGGAARTISVESVSFGSRDVIGRPATMTKASLSTNQGVW